MKKNGFTLIELLSIIVILAIILAIAIPSISALLENARKNAFEESVKLIIKGIETKQTADSNYNVTQIDETNIETNLGINADNYQTIDVSLSDSKVNVHVVGQNRWEELEANGSYTNLVISTGGVIATPKLASDSCYTFDSATGTINGYDFEDSSCPLDLIVSSTIGGVAVEHIGANAFTFEGPITYCEKGVDGSIWVEIKGGYTHVDGDGWDYCEDYTGNYGNLKSVYIPNTIKTIGDSTFYFNDLTAVEIEAGTSLETIEHAAFAANVIEDLILPEGSYSMGDSVFYGNHISNLNIPNGITAIPNNAFADNDITSLSLPDGLLSVEPYAFSNNQIMDLDLPSSLTTIGELSFRNNQITSVTIPNSITVIYESAFQNNQISSLTLPEGLTEIRYEVFEGNQLSSVTLPSTLTTIGSRAFSSNKLTSLSIPSSVNSISDGAFNNNLLPDAQAYVYARNADGSIDNTTTVSYGGSKKDNITIPSQVTKIGDYTFFNCSINSITIPSTVTTIGNEAFQGNKLTSITIPTSITAINSYAFSDNLLTSVVIPNSVTNLSGGAFRNNLLTSVTIPTSISSISYDTFNGNQLASIIIPSNITSISDDSFSDNPFTSITIQGANPQRFNAKWTSIGFPAELMP